MPFNPNIPQPTDKLSNSQVDLLNNNIALDATFGVDHIPFSTASNNGFHKVVHLVTQGSDPIGSTLTVYSKIPTNPPGAVDAQLFSRTPLGGVSQLTGANETFEGWQWLGGVLMQWGFVTLNGASGIQTGSVNFTTRIGPISYTFDTYNIQITPSYTSPSGPSGQATISVARNPTVNGFSWIATKTSSNFTGFYWVAIGK